MALATRPLTTTVPPAPSQAETATQLAEQLRYIKAILEMLAGGTWSAAAGAQLDASLGLVARAAGQLGWGELSDELGHLRRELADCVRRDRAPEPLAAATWHRALTQSLAPGPRLPQPAQAHAGSSPTWPKEVPQ